LSIYFAARRAAAHRSASPRNATQRFF